MAEGSSDDKKSSVNWTDLEVRDAPDFPGKDHLAAFTRMEVVFDKLKILQFESQLMPSFKRMGYKAITRDFFAWSHEEENSRNRVNMFFPFIALCQWLLQKCGHSDFMKEVDLERQDPSTTIKELGNILHSLNCRIPEGDERKIIRGYGAECVRILHILCDEAISKTKALWKKDPEYPEVSGDGGMGGDDDDAALVEDDNCEVLVRDDDSIEEESDENEENYVDLETVTAQKSKAVDMMGGVDNDLGSGGGSGMDSGANIAAGLDMECEIDPKDWREEVERVLPSLKVTVRADQKDWRSHIDQMETHKKAMETSKETCDLLEKLSRDITETLNKIESRESYINRALDVDINEYSMKNAQLSEIKAKYKKASSGIADRSHNLMQLTEELDRLKVEMEQRGSLLSNTEPLKSIRNSIHQVKNETMQMDMRIGVLQNILLHSKLID